MSKIENKKNLRKQILELVKQYGDLDKYDAPFEKGKSVVPPSGKVIGGNELKMMTDAVLDGWLTIGRYNEKFEKKIADYIGVKHVLTTNSGSSANLLAFTALTSPKLGDRQIKPGDEAITVAAGFPTTVNPILQNNCIPVFVDVEISTYNINTDLLEEAYSEKTKAVMLAHTLGNPYNLKKVKAFTEKHNLWLIEDCCDALGTEYEGKKVGTFGDIATLSFYPAHHITMGEGGAILTNNGKLKKIIESFRDWGRDCYCAPGCDNTCSNRFSLQLGDLPEGYDHKYIYSHLGYNLKITDMQAACGLAQLEQIEEFVKTRKDNFKYLTEKLQKFTQHLSLPQPTENSDPSWFGYPITIKDETTQRVDLLKYLDDSNIGSRLLFAGNLTKQPYFRGRNYKIVGNLENTDRIMNQTFWVGIYPGLNKDHLGYIVSRLDNYFGITDVGK
jgi:CDP-4-dehydro-6-deoxyglucose reductase, E1